MSEQKLRRNRDMGKNLRKLREKAGYSQEKICEILQNREIDIGRSTYQRYENNTLNIKISVLVELKKLYQCEYADFFDGLEL